MRKGMTAAAVVDSMAYRSGDAFSAKHPHSLPIVENLGTPVLVRGALGVQER